MEKGAKSISAISDPENAFPPKNRIGNNLDRPSDVGGGGGGGTGPTGSNSGGANEVVVDHTIHRDEYVSSSSFLDAKYSAKSTNNSQPFHKSPGEMVPFFTSAQWKELERQAMIYKYMTSSLPVPPHLLYPPLSCAIEAWRCKRTDGKKWRCSRDVAPQQKYCERHLQRGRPRSRKPVEKVNTTNNKDNGDENHKKPRLQQTKQFTTASDEQPLLLSNAKTDLSSIPTAPSHQGTNRDLGLMMESEIVTNNGAMQKWHHLLEPIMGVANEGSSIYGSSAIFHQDYNLDQHPLRHVLSYSNFSASEIDVENGFIDAWSADNLNDTVDNNVNAKSSLSTNHDDFCPSLNLSIAMVGGNRALDGDMGKVQMRDVVGFYDEDARLLSPVCWVPFGPGGPLAEALCGNPTSTVSSPSGVLQRTLFSHSGNSVCNSPSEIAFHRMK